MAQQSCPQGVIQDPWTPCTPLSPLNTLFNLAATLLIQFYGKRSWDAVQYSAMQCNKDYAPKEPKMKIEIKGCDLYIILGSYLSWEALIPCIVHCLNWSILVGYTIICRHDLTFIAYLEMACKHIDKLSWATSDTEKKLIRDIMV